MKQKERSLFFSYILIPLLFTLYTAGIHHHIFIKYYLQFIYLSFEHNHIIISQYYHHIIIKQNHHIIIIISVYHHIIIIEQNHHIIIIKQNHHIIIISYISCNNCNCIYKKIITGEIILNYRRIIKKNYQ